MITSVRLRLQQLAVTTVEGCDAAPLAYMAGACGGHMLPLSPFLSPSALSPQSPLVLISPILSLIFGRPFFVLCYRTVVCSVLCLSVTLVYRGQTVGWIKVPRGMYVGLGPGHIVLDGDPAHPPKGAQPPFSAHVCCGHTAGWIKMPLGRYYVGRPRPRRHGVRVRCEPSSSSPKMGRSPLPNFRPMSIVAKRLDESRQHLAWRWALVQATLS